METGLPRTLRPTAGPAAPTALQPDRATRRHEYQISTSWILKTLAATQPASRDIRNRSIAYARPLATGFEPDVLRIAYARHSLAACSAATWIQ